MAEQVDGGLLHVDVELDVLSRNDSVAARNRTFFREQRIVALNLMSSPGSGKTTLLEQTIRWFAAANEAAAPSISVIEGDQQTKNDARRIREAGASAVQVNTGDGCHLEASMVARALELLKPPSGSFVMIENVGNLVCPSMFDLGETARVVVISVTEGEDKPLKYPNAFLSADLCVINKIDLLPYLDFDLAALRGNILAVNPDIEIVEASCRQENTSWMQWLLAQSQRLEAENVGC